MTEDEWGSSTDSGPADFLSPWSRKRKVRCAFFKRYEASPLHGRTGGGSEQAQIVGIESGARREV
jgi:hypothetical protein